MLKKKLSNFRKFNAFSFRVVEQKTKGSLLKMLNFFSKKKKSNEKLISISPHNLTLFKYFIKYKLKKKYNFITSDQLYSNNFLPNKSLLIRHDLDYEPLKIKKIINIEEEFKIKSDIHVMVDNSSYKIKETSKFLLNLNDKGFHLGLHTNAPPKRNSLNYFEDEIEKFHVIFGFYPKTFSVHGPSISPKNWQNLRSKFLIKVSPLLKKYNIIGSHNISGVDYWIQDIGMGGEFSYLYRDFFTKELDVNKVLGILIHPEHWTEWPIQWSYRENKNNEHELIEDIVRSVRT